MADEVPMRLTNESGEWLTVPYTEEEIAERDSTLDIIDQDLSRIREERDFKLSNSDWTDLPNSALTAEKAAEWQTYRQTLRDYPSQSDRVSTLPEWPTQPE
tara:strand:+ start:218 stop:520 length:303 start_codon:yes stop_codon:yes gene_type:complete